MTDISFMRRSSVLATSIKWKISASFVALTIAVVGLYVFMAKETFESDKISYIFDSEQVKVENLAKQIEQKIEITHFRARSILAGIDPATKNLTSISQELFQSASELKAIEIYDPHATESFVKLEKLEGVMPAYQPDEGVLEGRIEVRCLAQDQYLIYSREKNELDEVLVFRVVVEFHNLLPRTNTADLLFSQGTQVLAAQGPQSVQGIAGKILEDLSKDRSQSTTSQKVGKDTFLISSVPLKYSALRVTSIISQDKALEALSILFKRSLVFLAFSMFATIIISLLLSSGLTRSLQLLAATAKKIGQGDFSSLITIKSKDEIGVLSNAFSTMSKEIQRLLIETQDKARMEAELKTAKLVQESLFPRNSEYKKEGLDLSGLFVTSSECGGDWWYYFERDEYTYIVIADATGHGTPAALITSAARAVFSQLEHSNCTIEEMMTAWNQVVSVCSNQSVYMTALILEIHRKSGIVKCINASHELPVVFKRERGSYVGEPLMIPVSPRLGQDQKPIWQNFQFQLNPDEKMIVYTDGLTGMENADGKVLSEKRALKAFQIACDESRNAKELNEKVRDIFEKHRNGHPLADDVTLVALERGG